MLVMPVIPVMIVLLMIFQMFLLRPLARAVAPPPPPPPPPLQPADYDHAAKPTVDGYEAAIQTYKHTNIQTQFKTDTSVL